MLNLTLSDGSPFNLGIDYWKKRLKGVKSMNLFTDHAKPDIQSSNKARIDFLIDEKINKQLSQFSEQQKVTLFVTLLSAYKVLLYRYSTQEDICVGNAIVNSEYDKKTKYFVNVLALCTTVNGNDNFDKLLQRVNSTVVHAFKHQKTPFEKEVDSRENDLERSMNPLYQVMFIFQNELEFPDELLSRYTSKSDLTFILKEKPSGLQGTVEYSADLYREDTIVHIIDHYKLLLNSIIANPQKSIGTLPILTIAEEHKFLKKLNSTAFKYPKNKFNIGEALPTASSTDTEKRLAKIWAKILGMPEETITIKSDFFDIGGHSIKAMRLRGLIHKELGVKLSLKELFSENTIERQARTIDNKELNAYAAKELVPEQPDYVLSSAQRRLWVLNQFDVTESAYNIPYVILLEGYLDKAALKKAFKAMISRHEILRTVFKEDKEGNPRQQIINAGAYTFKLKETDLRNTADKKFILNNLLDQETSGSFNLSKGPLLRCHLMQLEEDKYVLAMVHHHIISDGWSMDVFRKEWCAFYNAYL
ncbi:MAG: Nonribosomal peptide synthetase, partial [Mucilaginibacter sp.]|nr:Nonribosomal peptide synthetase [Mucilaginibacter sp.]